MPRTYLWFVLAIALLLLAGAAQADQAITSTLTVQRVTLDEKGQEVLVPADKVKPGEVLLYTAVFTNTTDKLLTKIEPQLPIPSGTVLLKDGAVPAGVRASIDGITYDAVPLKRKVKQADGTIKVVDVPLAEYRFLKWRFEKLEAHATLTVSARVKVTTAVTVPAKATTR
jgi:hypothetical protein